LGNLTSYGKRWDLFHQSPKNLACLLQHLQVDPPAAAAAIDYLKLLKIIAIASCSAGDTSKHALNTNTAACVVSRPQSRCVERVPVNLNESFL
jgi:hypothetical protein